MRLRKVESGALACYAVELDGQEIGRVRKVESGYHGMRWNGKAAYSNRVGNQPEYFRDVAWTYEPYNPAREEETRRKDAVASLIYKHRQAVSQ